MSEQVNQQELVQYIADASKLDPNHITVVLKHEETYINKANANAKGEVDIDSDDLVDYVMSRPDVKLNELQVETILDLEMDYLMEQGLAGYVD
jgi:hypothetical protein